MIEIIFLYGVLVWYHHWTPLACCAAFNIAQVLINKSQRGGWFETGWVAK